MRCQVSQRCQNLCSPASWLRSAAMLDAAALATDAAARVVAGLQVLDADVPGRRPERTAAINVQHVASAASPPA